MPEYLERYREIYLSITAYVVDKNQFDNYQLDRYYNEANRLLHYIIDTRAERSFEHNKALIIRNCKKNAVAHAFNVPQRDQKLDSIDDYFNLKYETSYVVPNKNPEEILIRREEIEKKIFICREQNRLLSRFLPNLSVEERKIYRLRLYKDMAYQKIAEKVKIPWATVRRRYLKIMAKLKDYYMEIDEQTRADKIAEAAS